MYNTQTYKDYSQSDIIRFTKEKDYSQKIDLVKYIVEKAVGYRIEEDLSKFQNDYSKISNFIVEKLINLYADQKSAQDISKSIIEAILKVEHSIINLKSDKLKIRLFDILSKIILTFGSKTIKKIIMLEIPNGGKEYKEFRQTLINKLTQFDETLNNNISNNIPSNSTTINTTLLLCTLLKKITNEEIDHNLLENSEDRYYILGEFLSSIIYNNNSSLNKDKTEILIEFISKAREIILSLSNLAIRPKLANEFLKTLANCDNTLLKELILNGKFPQEFPKQVFLSSLLSEISEEKIINIIGSICADFEKIDIKNPFLYEDKLTSILEVINILLMSDSTIKLPEFIENKAKKLQNALLTISKVTSSFQSQRLKYLNQKFIDDFQRLSLELKNKGKSCKDTLQKIYLNLKENLSDKDVIIRTLTVNTIGVMNNTLIPIQFFEFFKFTTDLLLERIENETSCIVYKAILDELFDKIITLSNCNQYEITLYIIKRLYKITQSIKEEEFKSILFDKFQNLSKNKLLFYTLLNGSFSSNPTIRNNSFSILENLGTLSCKTLIEILKESEDVRIKTSVLNVMKNIGKPVINSILEELDSQTSWYLKRNLISVLGEIGDKSFIEDIKKYTKDSVMQVRKETYQTMFKIGYQSPELNRALSEALKDVKNEICPFLIKLIGEKRYDKMIPSLIEILKFIKENPLQEYDPLLKEVCIALVNIKSYEVVPLLLEFIQKKSLLSFKKEISDLGKSYVISALGEIGDEQVIPYLENILKNKNSTLKEQAQKSLTKINERLLSNNPISEEDRIIHKELPIMKELNQFQRI